MPIVSIFVRVLLAILIAIVVAFAIWFIGWLIITFLGVSAGVIALGKLIENVSYFAGAVAGVWFLVAGYKRFPNLVK